MRATLTAMAIGLFGLALPSQGADSSTVTTPRGTDVHVTVHRPSGSNLPVVVVAPGQSCNSLGPIFETLGIRGQERGYVVVRFEWSYCNSHPNDPQPSADLSAEVEDFATVLNYATSLPGIDASHIYVAGKSLGSMVGFKLFAATASAKALVLLTPVCSYDTDDDGHQLPSPLPVTEESYPELKHQSRPIFMIGGNNDSLCHLPILYGYLGDSSGNITTAAVGGDHGLRIMAPGGSVDQTKTQANIETAIASVLNWMDLQ